MKKMHLQVFLLLGCMFYVRFAASQAMTTTTTRSPTTTRALTSTQTSASTTTKRKLGWDDNNYIDDSPPQQTGYGYNGNKGYGDRGYGNRGYGNRGYGNRGYGYDNDNYGYGDDEYNNYDPDEYDNRTPRRKRMPDEYGNLNIYVRDPSNKYGKTKKYKKMRFPVNRFKPGHFPPLPPLISFFPWLPIFADKFTKQTIIFSPTGGLYIIPPLINFYGQLFSVAELIASGYASLVSSGVPPPPGLNVAPLVAPGAVAGPGIPPTNVVTGGFSGGVQSKFGAFPAGGNAGQKAPPSKGGYGY